MQKWTIEYIDGFHKCLKKLGGNEKRQFKNKVIDLELAENPKRLGELKGTKRHGYCYVTDITSSYRLAYLVNEQKHKILLMILDDHKNVYGRDKKT